MDNTFISLILPTHNRLPMLQQTIASVLTQRYPHDRFEIIVINDGSSDGTTEWLQEQPATLDGITFRSFTTQQGGVCKARNQGIAHAGGALIAFIDDDCIADPDWLMQLVKRMGEQNNVGVGGRIIARESDNVISRFCSFIHYNECAMSVDEPLWFLNTANMLIQRSTLYQAGLFDETFRYVGADDQDLSDRLRKNKVAFLPCPTAIVHHLNKDTLRGIHRVAFNQAHGVAHTYAKNHPRNIFGYIAQYSFKLLLCLLLFIPDIIIRTIKNLFHKIPPADAFIFAVLIRTTKICVLWGRILGRYEHRAATPHCSMKADDTTEQPHLTQEGEA